jgi:tetratricopeptide (TPR) repeat protein
MNEDDEDSISANRPASAAAEAIALGATGNLDPRAAAYLEEQTRLSRLQSQNLIEQNAFELSHLKWRRFNDQMRGALQIMLVAVGALIVVGIGAAMWNASEADGLVVEAFSVPPDFVQRGLGGDVVAGDLTSKIGAVRQLAMDNSYSRSSDVSKDRENEIKVEIPETGISIAEAWRILRNWLGHERHLSGTLRNTADGKLELTATLDGGTALSAKGADLGKMEQTLAEEIFGNFDPVNYTNYFTASGRFSDAYAAASRYVPIAEGLKERSDSYGLWSYTTAFYTGDIRLAVARAEIGVKIDPAIAVTYVQAMRGNIWLGHDEQALQEAREILPLNDADQLKAHHGSGFAAMLGQAKTLIDESFGDFEKNDIIAVGTCLHGCSMSQQLLSQAANVARSHDADGGRALMAEATAAGSTDPSRLAETRYDIDAASGNWANAASAIRAADIAFRSDHSGTSPRFLATAAATRFTPLQAEAMVKMGHFSDAHALIDTTPGDCYLCVRMRGNIDAAQRDWGGAQYWFGHAVEQGPSIPFAYLDWGRMLMSKGDLDGAIAKLQQANAKGPHFADPLEIWGEALMLKNRSDLALAKFSEANKYAPNWGRLHLKWGEALIFLGRNNEALDQFAAAERLEESIPDRAELEDHIPRL